MDGSDASVGRTVNKDGKSWEIGQAIDVAWITSPTEDGLSITSGIPPVFDAYATIAIPERDWPPQTEEEHERRIMRLLTAKTADQDWWLGYLDTGADDVVFPDAPRVLMYAEWGYVLVKAGPSEAKQWRSEASTHTRLPDLMFPADRTWITSALWDDDWWCLGGSGDLVEAFLSDPGLEVYKVSMDSDATPPGHVAL